MRHIHVHPILLLLFLASCATTRKIDLPADKSQTAVLLPFAVKELKITDLRDSLRSMDWKLPSVYPKKKSWTGNPELSIQNKTDIERIVKSTEPKENGMPALFEIKINAGECKLKMDSTKIREYIHIKAELTVSVPGRAVKYGSIAEGNYENPVYEASKEHVLQLYNLVLRNVTTELLKEVRDDIGN